MPCATTASQRVTTSRLEPGFNSEAIKRAALEFQGFPVIECSDEARALRFIEPRLDKSGRLELLGKCWNPDVDTWQNQIVNVPEMDPAKGDVDEFSALKRLVDGLIKSDSLSKSVSVHNFTALCSTDKPDIAHCMWPTPNSGYKAMHLLKFLEKLRWFL